MALTRPSRICACRFKIRHGELCPCEKQRKAEADANRPGARARGYTREWEKARAEFLRQHPRCAMCGRKATVVDHIRPHHGNQALFWDRSNNWQPLCTPCHSSRKQRQDLAAIGGRRQFKPLQPGGGQKLSADQSGPERGPAHGKFPDPKAKSEVAV